MNTKGQILVPLKSVGVLPLTVAELLFPLKSEFIILFAGRRLSYLPDVYTKWKFHWRVRWDAQYTSLKNILLENLVNRDVYESKHKRRVRPSVGGVLRKQRLHTGTITPSSFTVLSVMVKKWIWSLVLFLELFRGWLQAEHKCIAVCTAFATCTEV